MRRTSAEDGSEQEAVVGEHVFRRRRGRDEYVMLARICRPGRRHLFLVSGQTGVSNQAAAHHLTATIGALRRRFGDDRTFCLALRVIESETYGHREVEEVAEVTAQATTPARR